jgi:hypothetical protein
MREPAPNMRCTRPSRSGCNPGSSRAGSLRLDGCRLSPAHRHEKSSRHLGAMMGFDDLSPCSRFIAKPTDQHSCQRIDSRRGQARYAPSFVGCRLAQHEAMRAPGMPPPGQKVTESSGYLHSFPWFCGPGCHCCKIAYLLSDFGLVLSRRLPPGSVRL